MPLPHVYTGAPYLFSLTDTFTYTCTHSLHHAHVYSHTCTYYASIFP